MLIKVLSALFLLLQKIIQYKSDTEWFYEHLKHRMGHFGLSLEEEKSRLIEFGCYAKERCRKAGCGKAARPEFCEGCTTVRGAPTRPEYCSSFFVF